MRVTATLLLLLAAISSSPSSAQIVLTPDQGYVQHFDELGRDKQAELPDGIRIGLYPPGASTQPFSAAQHTASQFRGGSRMRSDASAGVYNLGAGDSLLARRRAPGIVLSDDVGTGVFFFPVVNQTGETIDSVDVGIVEALYACDSNTTYQERLLISYDGVAFEEVGAISSFCFEPAGLASPPGVTTLPFDRHGISTRPIEDGSTFYIAFEVTNDFGGAPRKTLAMSIEQFSVTAAGMPIPPVLKLHRRDIPASPTMVGTRGGSWVGATSIMGEDTVRARSFVMEGEHPGEFTVSFGYQTPLSHPAIARYAQVSLLYDFYPAEPGLRSAYAVLDWGGVAFDTLFMSGIGLTTLFGGTSGDALLDSLRAHYTSASTFGYDRARDTLFAYAHDGDRTSITDIYAGMRVGIPAGADPTISACNGDGDNNSSSCNGPKNINTEHAYPQSKGASSGPARGDMHHLYPTRADVNSSRGNDPYGWVGESEATRYYWGTESATCPAGCPPADPYLWSATNGSAFQPRAEVRGDLARAIFYFYTIYRNEADAADPAFFDSMKETLLAWHRADLPDTAEVARSERIAMYQGNINPFTIDTSLVARAYFPTTTGAEVVDEIVGSELRVYPSPARTAVTVEGSGPFEVFDVLGRRVGSGEGERVRLDVSRYPAGHYFVRRAGQTESFTVLR